MAEAAPIQETEDDDSSKHKTLHQKSNRPTQKTFYTPNGIEVSLRVADIVKQKADGIVTSEDECFQYDSNVTQALYNTQNGSHFRDCRKKHRPKEKNSYQFGDVLHSNMNPWPLFPFKYVMHCVISPYNKKDYNTWMNQLSDLYANILVKTDSLNIKHLVLPFLGTGHNGANMEETIDVAIHAVKNHQTKHVKSVKFVCLEIRPISHANSVCQTLLCEGDSTSSEASSQERHIANGVENLSLREHLTPHQGSDFHEDHTRDSDADSVTRSDVDENENCKLGESPSVASSSDSAGEDRQDTDTIYVNESNQNSLETIEQNVGYDVTPSDSLDKEGPFCDIETSEKILNDVETDSIPDDVQNVKVPEEEQSCPICMDSITDEKILDKCGHKFCRGCIDESFHHFKPVCPSCQTVYGVLTGNMPKGHMQVKRRKFPSLEGHEGCGIIIIHYTFADGTQTEKHPKPGVRYRGTSREAYLPDNSEGNTVLRLLTLAFERNLTFTVGRSVTTGRDDCVIWNDIHHKTCTSGGSTNYGYPDDTYLSRVKEELACKGVTEDQLN